MCCSVSPRTMVKFSDTILYASEVQDASGRIVHVLGYENTAQNNVGEDNTSKIGLKSFWHDLVDLVTTQNRNRTDEFVASRIAGDTSKLPAKSLKTNPKAAGNAMILPFPCVPRTMTKANVLDTAKCPTVLQDIAWALESEPTLHTPYLSFSMPETLRKVQIFEAAGIYTVVLAQDARDIPEALAQVPAEKRPGINPELFSAYAEWYPDWTFALCCFNNQDAKRALPLLWWYEPMNTDQLFLPALDCHTGDVPNLRARVSLDHTIAVGSYRLDTSIDAFVSSEKAKFESLKPKAESNNQSAKVLLPDLLSLGSDDEKMDRYEEEFRLDKFLKEKRQVSEVHYSEIVPDSLRTYLPRWVKGSFYRSAKMRNGDFICKLDHIISDKKFSLHRQLPPGSHH